MRVLNRRTQLFFSWSLAVLYADLIYVLSSLENISIPFEGKFHIDKLVHGVEYAVFGVLVARALRLSFRFRSWTKLLWTA